MNFFEHQAKAKRNTTQLVFLFSLAIISLIVITQIFVLAIYAWSKGIPVTDEASFLYAMSVLGTRTFLSIATAIVGIVVLAWLYKSAQLASGGKAVAEALDGRLINHSTGNLDEKKILNVVEEMAIASGIAVPPVYILEEYGINAFAAGYTHKDAVIGITRGSIRSLNRDELQGVIAHEFSHIFNGDMRLNIKLISVLHGILFIGMIGDAIVFGEKDIRDERQGIGAIQLLPLGMGLLIIGYLGASFANLIKAAVNWQREFLADASAIQFTRNPEGITDALKKIGGYPIGSYITHARTYEFSHFFFNPAKIKRTTDWTSSHPPLEERIRRIEPNQKITFIKVSLPDEIKINPYLLKPSWKGFPIDSDAYKKTEPPRKLEPIEFIAGLAAVASTNTLADTPAIASTGLPTQQHVEEAQQLLYNIPDQLKKLARDPYDVQALVYSFLLDKHRADTLEKQLHYLEKKIPADIYREIMRIKDQVATLPAQHRLPLIDIAIATLKQISLAQYLEFKANLLALIKADNVIDLLEWSMYRMLSHHLENKASTPIGYKSLASLQTECQRLLSAIAIASSEDMATARIFFQKGWGKLSLPDAQLIEDCLQDMAKLDMALKRANLMHPLKKPQFIKACCYCLHSENDPEGIELIRVIADSLDVPHPPLLTGQSFC